MVEIKLCRHIRSPLFLDFLSREMLGPQLVFINLTMNAEDKKKRLMKRHEGSEQFVKLMEVNNIFLIFGKNFLCIFRTLRN